MPAVLSTVRAPTVSLWHWCRSSPWSTLLPTCAGPLVLASSPTWCSPKSSPLWPSARPCSHLSTAPSSSSNLKGSFWSSSMLLAPLSTFSSAHQPGRPSRQVQSIDCKVGGSRVVLGSVPCSANRSHPWRQLVPRILPRQPCIRKVPLQEHGYLMRMHSLLLPAYRDPQVLVEGHLGSDPVLHEAAMNKIGTLGDLSTGVAEVVLVGICMGCGLWLEDYRLVGIVLSGGMPFS